MIDKTSMINKLDENSHTTGPKAEKPNFFLVEKLQEI